MHYIPWLSSPKVIFFYIHKPNYDSSCILSRCASLCWKAYLLRWCDHESGFVFVFRCLMLAIMLPRFTLSLLASCTTVLPPVLRFDFVSMIMRSTCCPKIPFNRLIQPSYHFFTRRDASTRDAVERCAA